jgi:hypothetical protein
MAKKVYSRAELEAMNDKLLKKMALHKMGITGISKKVKSEVIDTILAKQDSGSASVSSAPKASGAMSGLDFTGRSVMADPRAPFGQRATTTIHVACGANSGSFDVVGRKVTEVADFLREVLNIDRLSTGLVNGKEVDASYSLKSGDRLEFLKPAGRKG